MKIRKLLRKKSPKSDPPLQSYQKDELYFPSKRDEAQTQGKRAGCPRASTGSSCLAVARRLAISPLRNPSGKKKIGFSQDERISPKLQETVQPVHTHQLAECSWQWTRRLVIAPHCNHTQICFSQEKRDQPQAPGGPAACVHQMTECT